MKVAEWQLELKSADNSVPNLNHQGVIPDALELPVRSENLQLFCQSRWLQNNFAVLW